jgi:flagellar protein FliO/FliZ
VEGASSVVQMVLSLVAVVAVILGLAWMTRRLQGLRANSNGELRVKATLAVGMKERVVLIEAAGRQFLIGVAPGQVRLLDALGAVPDEAPTAAEPGLPAPLDSARGRPSFREALAQQLGQLIGR